MIVPFVATPSWLAEGRPAAVPRVDAVSRPARGSAGPGAAARPAPVERAAASEGAAVSERAAGQRGPAGVFVAAPSGGASVAPSGASDGAASGTERDAASVDVSALGPLAPFADDERVTDLFVNGESGLWVDRGDGVVPAAGWEADEAEVRRLAVALVAAGGRHIDEATPAVDVRLGAGIRVHAVLPPVSRSGTLVSVRIPRQAGRTVAELAAGGMLTSAELGRLRAAVAARENLLITGAAGTGKTTLLAALLAEAPPRERIVVVEDVGELEIAHPHVIGLEARQANLEGAGRVGLDALVREALRMRPDRLVVGECRGPELRELFGALNTGHDGGAGTLHANSLDDVPARLEALGASAGMGPTAVARQAASAFDLVVHLERAGGRRRVQGIGRLELRGERLEVAA
ncbi:TadA family conjugal transfer-associated ATPase [Agromyces archimandritae]|uniref:TadA family conjugal transfer-associated ATPase n=1 Tax=Agromyces archimandritae TaxID=2781962 RepID=A0A975FPG1_9MICO|nr:TadA family conjugal transfer-associated ATPase [Agromyces archimandritae]QTX05417.1 TadA family conjugal transfer-associated ATPase [Agromyces archimandritae]